MPFLANDELNQDFDPWTQFITTHLETSMELDAMRSSHPIQMNVGYPDEISQMFDVITYSKVINKISIHYSILQFHIAYYILYMLPTKKNNFSTLLYSQ